VSGQVRYGRTRSRSAHFASVTGSGSVATFSATNRERHWLVDFAVGRDLGIGLGQTQVKAGVRIAELNSRTNIAVAYSGFGSYAVEFRSKFLGVGPRVGLEGTVPLGGAWSFDWLAGVAVLFGDRKLDVAGIEISSSSSGILNIDAQAGISYLFDPSAKVTLSYRFDGYWDALRTIDIVGGGFVNGDRFNHGPMLRFTLVNGPR
jgi:hypothetical protein